MTHIVVGFPSIDRNMEIVSEMVKCGVKKIELQIPFSDPLADGPVISKACEKALENGIKVKDSFELMEKVAKKYPEVSFYFMTYFNIIFNYGVNRFCSEAKQVNAKGIISPDMPIDEEKYEGFYFACRENELSPIFVVSPITSDERLKMISEYAKDFLYCTSVIGTTGIRSTINKDLKKYVKKLKTIFDIPIAVGFGISTKDQVDEVLSYADIAVIGSAILKEEGEKQFEIIRELFY